MVVVWYYILQTTSIAKYCSSELRSNLTMVRVRRGGTEASDYKQRLELLTSATGEIISFYYAVPSSSPATRPFVVSSNKDFELVGSSLRENQ